MVFDSEYSGKFRKRKDKQLYNRACYWYKELLWKDCSTFRLVNAPDTINPDVAMYNLLINGSAVMQHVKAQNGNDEGVYLLPGVRYGLDPYHFPKKVNIVNHAVSAPQQQNGVEAQWIRANRFAMPIIPMINEDAEQLAMLDVGVSTNIPNSYTTAIFRARNDLEAQAIRKMYDNMTGGEPAVLVKNGVFGGINKDNILNNDTRYLVHDYLNDQDRIISRHLARLGVESTPIQKEERLITAEVRIKARELAISRSFWLDAMNADLAKANNIFGTNMRVEAVVPTEDEMRLLEWEGGDVYDAERIASAADGDNVRSDVDN